jgi:prepilin-type processing-associated H-X9-DG protein
MAFMENTALAEAFNTTTTVATSSAAPYNTNVYGIKCPSDSGTNSGSGSYGTTNYMFCTGDWMPSPGYEQNNQRGAFVMRTIVVRTLGDIIDGTSNTIAVSEHPIGSGSTLMGNVEMINRDAAFGSASGTERARLCLNRAPGGEINKSAVTYQSGDSGGPIVQTAAGYGRGSRAWCGIPTFTLFSTILPPNSPSCRSEGASASTTGRVLTSAASFHAGGVNVVLCDGSGKFVPDSVDTGTLDSEPVSSGKSPFGIWGAAGSISGQETGPL